MHPLKYIIGNCYYGHQGIIIWASDTVLSHKDCAKKFGLSPTSAGFLTYNEGQFNLFGESESLNVSADILMNDWVNQLPTICFSLGLLNTRMLNCKMEVTTLFYLGDEVENINKRYMNRVFHDPKEVAPLTLPIDCELDILIDEAHNPDNKYERRSW